MPQPQNQPDQLDRIAADAASAARALAQQKDPTAAFLASVLGSDVLPLIKSLATEMGERDSDLDGRLSDIEDGIDGALQGILGAQRDRVIDILERAILLGEEVCALEAAPSQQMKEKARLLAAMAAEARKEIEENSDEEPEEDGEGAPEGDGDGKE